MTKRKGETIESKPSINDFIFVITKRMKVISQKLHVKHTDG